VPRVRFPPLGFDADRGQILKPALCLHEAVNLWRQPARIEVMRDKDQRCSSFIISFSLVSRASRFTTSNSLKICSTIL
jgi:hypothetical protein